MPHFRVDDGLDSHPKAERAGDDALGMWVRAGSWCMRYLTDGFIPEWWVKKQPNGTRKARKLVASGLWIDGQQQDGEKGYKFHEFVGPGRQDSREKIESDREMARKRKQKSRRESQQESHRDASVDNSKSGAESTTKSVVETLEKGRHIEQYNDRNGLHKPTGTEHAQPSANSANAQMSRRDSRGESRRSPGYTQPNPTQPISVETLRGEGPEADARDPNAPPPPHCPKHPGGTDTPCRACGAARQQHETWTANQTRAEVDRRAAFRAEIANCPDCDDHGWTDTDTGVTRCTRHDWETTHA